MSDQKNWNNRFAVDQPGVEEQKRLPKVPKYRRKNGEEIKGTLFTGPTKPLGPSKAGGSKYLGRHRIVQNKSYTPSRVHLQPLPHDMNERREHSQQKGELHLDLLGHQESRTNRMQTIVPEQLQTTSPFVLKRLSHIGRGSTATVYRSFHSGKFQIVAEKAIFPTNEARRSNLVHELMTLRTLLGSTDDQRRQYIVGLVDVLSGPRAGDPSGGSVSVCLEYMHATLQDVVETGGCMQEVVLSGMVRQMLLGLSFIHEKRFLHRDFKPANVLVNTSGCVKISDLGLSIDLPKGASLAESFTGTYHYMSPERIDGGKYSYASDVWGLGMTVLACAMGRYPYDIKRGYWALLTAIKEEPVPMPDSIRFSETFRDFIILATKKNPDERSSSLELLRHPFVSSHWTDVDSNKGEEDEYSRTARSPPTGHEVDAMKTSSEWICTSIGSLMRRPAAEISPRMVQSKPGKNPYQSSSSSKYSKSAPGKGEAGYLPGESVLISPRGKIVDPDAESCDSEEELKAILLAFRNYLHYAWRTEGIRGESPQSSPDRLDGEDKVGKIDPLATVTASSLQVLALHISVPVNEVKTAFLSLIKGLKSIFLKAIKESEKLDNVLYGAVQKPPSKPFQLVPIVNSKNAAAAPNRSLLPTSAPKRINIVHHKAPAANDCIDKKQKAQANSKHDLRIIRAKAIERRRDIISKSKVTDDLIKDENEVFEGELTARQFDHESNTIRIPQSPPTEHNDVYNDPEHQEESGTYLDDYFEDLVAAEELIPFEATGLDGVSPEKKRGQHSAAADDFLYQDYDNLALDTECTSVYHNNYTKNEHSTDQDTGYEEDVAALYEQTEDAYDSPSKFSHVGDVVESEHVAVDYNNTKATTKKSKALKFGFQVGDKIGGRYGSGAKWYAGIISAVNESDGTYDIRYNDGDQEFGISETLIRSSGAESGRPVPVIRKTLDSAIPTRDDIESIQPHTDVAQQEEAEYFEEIYSSPMKHRASTPKATSINFEAEDRENFDDPNLSFGLGNELQIENEHSTYSADFEDVDENVTLPITISEEPSSLHKSLLTVDADSILKVEAGGTVHNDKPLDDKSIKTKNKKNKKKKKGGISDVQYDSPSLKAENSQSDYDKYGQDFFGCDSNGVTDSMTMPSKPKHTTLQEANTTFDDLSKEDRYEDDFYDF